MMSFSDKKKVMERQVKIFLKEEVYQIIGAAIEVHRELGNGFLEAVYHEALELELTSREIPFKSQVPLKIKYKDTVLRKEYVADLICFNSVVVEIKALGQLGGGEESQIINYLKATGLKVGLLVNFGSVGKLEWKKFVL
jgi:GxxExxY protein